jgi:hypothetical protein
MRCLIYGPLIALVRSAVDSQLPFTQLTSFLPAKHCPYARRSRRAYIDHLDHYRRSLVSFSIDPMRASQGASRTRRMASARLDRLSFPRIWWT